MLFTIVPVSSTTCTYRCTCGQSIIIIIVVVVVFVVLLFTCDCISSRNVNSDTYSSVLVGSVSSLKVASCDSCINLSIIDLALAGITSCIA